jgi:aminopeptidase N
VLAADSWRFRDRATYGSLVYSKTALTMATLERLLGTPEMDKALRLYADRWRFRHPTTRDFIAAVRDATGRDWQWFFDRTFYSSGIVDYAVEQAETAPAKAPRGLFERDGKLQTGAPASRVKPRGWDTVVTVVRQGDVAMPVDVLLRFEGGRTHRARWDGEARWKRYRVASGPKLSRRSSTPTSGSSSTWTARTTAAAPRTTRGPRRAGPCAPCSGSRT